MKERGTAIYFGKDKTVTEDSPLETSKRTNQVWMWAGQRIVPGTISYSRTLLQAAPMTATRATKTATVSPVTTTPPYTDAQQLHVIPFTFVLWCRR